MPQLTLHGALGRDTHLSKPPFLLRKWDHHNVNIEHDRVSKAPATVPGSEGPP